MRRRSGMLAGALLALLLAAACEPEREPERAFPRGLGGAASSRDTPRAGAPPADTPPQTRADPSQPTRPAAAPSDNAWTVGILTGEGSDRIATQREVRVARNDGYDRIVLDLGADALPDWRVEYVDTPVRQCGSGEEVRLAGDAWLWIRLTPAQAHDDAGAATVATRALRPQLPGILELRLICDFEGHVEWVAGVRAPEPYRVLRLREPTRLVVDVRHPRS